MPSQKLHVGQQVLCIAEVCLASARCFQCGQHMMSHAYLRRVCKQIKHFAYWMRTHSPGSDLDFVADVYKIANRHPNLVHTHKPPRLALSKRDYEVTLEQYGFSANPTTLRVMLALLIGSSLTPHHSSRSRMSS